MASLLTSELRRITKAGRARLKLNLAEFNAEVRRFTDKMLPQELVTFHKRLVLQALRGIVKRTPVDTGRARGNWQTTIGAPASGVVEGTDKAGGLVISRGIGAITGLRPFSTVWLTNNLPYAEALEAGWSAQAPIGMVAITIAELSIMFR